MEKCFAGGLFCWRCHCFPCTFLFSLSFFFPVSLKVNFFLPRLFSLFFYLYGSFVVIQGHRSCETCRTISYASLAIYTVELLYWWIVLLEILFFSCTFLFIVIFSFSFFSKCISSCLTFCLYSLSGSSIVIRVVEVLKSISYVIFAIVHICNDIYLAYVLCYYPIFIDNLVN